MKKILSIILVVVLVLSLSACGAETSMDSYSPSELPKTESSVMDGEYSIPEVVSTDRIIIYSYSATVKVEEIDSALAQIKSALPASAWVESMSQDENDGRIVIRIESGSAESFVDSLGEIGDVSRVSQSSEDVTTSYNNADQKVQVLEIEQERLIELLKVATVSEAIEINQRLSEIEISLKSLYGEMTTYESLAKYSTVTINLFTDFVYVQDGFFTRLADALGDSWEVFQSLLIFVISLAVYAVPIGLIVILIMKVYKKKKPTIKEKEESEDKTE